jgi:FMN phosphatase YigB (HAD superfamily)
MNIFFDVDETILGYDGSLRPLVHQTFQALVDEGHRIYIWSGVRTGAMVRSEVVEPHGLAAFVTDCYQKPRFDYREQWRRTGIEVQPDFCVDDYPEIVEEFGGVLIKPYPRERPDTELERVYAAIKVFSAGRAPAR